MQPHPTNLKQPYPALTRPNHKAQPNTTNPANAAQPNPCIPPAEDPCKAPAQPLHYLPFQSLLICMPQPAARSVASAPVQPPAGRRMVLQRSTAPPPTATHLSCSVSCGSGPTRTLRSRTAPLRCMRRRSEIMRQWSSASCSPGTAYGAVQQSGMSVMCYSISAPSHCTRMNGARWHSDHAICPSH